uniref:uncharacterized protein LOC120331967 isoform X1 n=1 Tax=Styela clava TaxID=7725 RepID=UPI00193ADD98|nr:uncharacterized protein LOC120331967 isoform X1 [Styela clava]
MAAVKCMLLVLFAGTLQSAFCQCNDTSLVIKEGNGKFMSPNYRNEYGKSASCMWEFQPPTDGKDYSLSLAIVYQRLYFVVGSDVGKDCSGNYSLYINNEKQDCQRYIGFPNQYVTLMFYDSNSCGAGSPHQSLSSGVTVRYNSKGLLSSSDQFSMGFEIQYKFTECIKVATIKNEVGNVSSYINFARTKAATDTSLTELSEVATITNEVGNVSTSINSAWTKATTDTSLTELTERTVNTNTETTPSPSGMSQTTLILLLLFILIGVSLMVVAGIVFYRKRRLQLGANADTAQGTVPNSTEMRNAIPAKQNVTSGADGYEEVQAGPSGKYEAVQPATIGYENVQNSQAADEYEVVRSTTVGYKNVQNRQVADEYEEMPSTTVGYENVQNKQAADGYEEVQSTTVGYLNLQTKWLDDGYEKVHIKETTRIQDVEYH